MSIIGKQKIGVYRQQVLVVKEKHKGIKLGSLTEHIIALFHTGELKIIINKLIKILNVTLDRSIQTETTGLFYLFMFCFIHHFQKIFKTSIIKAYY